MRFYPPNPRMGPNQPAYRQRFGPSNRMGRQDESFYYPNRFRRRDDSYSYPYQYSRQPQPYYYPPQDTGYDAQFGNPYEQQQQYSQFGGGGRLPGRLNSLMGHAGTLTNGYYMMRQIGSLLGMFRF